MRCWLLVLTLLLGLVTGVAPAAAHEAVPYQERIMAGPYPVDVWVSDWPIAAERSVDLTFTSEGGITDKTARIRMIMPDGSDYFESPLPRHPRNRSVWGLDLIALPEAGPWRIELTVDGAEGIGTGMFGPMALLEQPGPPPTLSWLLGVLPPLILLGGLFAIVWRRFPASARSRAWSWQPDATA